MNLKFRPACLELFDKICNRKLLHAINLYGSQTKFCLKECFIFSFTQDQFQRLASIVILLCRGLETFYSSPAHNFVYLFVIIWRLLSSFVQCSDRAIWP